MRKPKSKARATKIVYSALWSDERWQVRSGELKRARGRPRKTKPLFKVIGEKLPFDALQSVRDHLRTHNFPLTGVYAAHDSMGAIRYVGRGSIFRRLASCRRHHPLELVYFSFYIVVEKIHEREIETLLIRAGGAELQFNTRKKRIDISPGSVKDYEAGTLFYVRQSNQGRKKVVKK